MSCAWIHNHYAVRASGLGMSQRATELKTIVLVARNDDEQAVCINNTFRAVLAQEVIEKCYTPLCET